MAWEIVAIWAIVVATLVWFRRDEDRERSKALAEQARYFATAPRYRHRHIPKSEPLAETPPQAMVHRRYLDLLKSGGPAPSAARPG